MKIGNRSLKQLYWVLSRKENYYALINFFKLYKNPIRQIFKELFGIHKFPKKVVIKGKDLLFFQVDNADDIATIHAVFCREDYKINSNKNVIIDIGSNKGFTIGYFLSKNEDNFVYGFEPEKNNFIVLEKNLSQFAAHNFKLKECAVSNESGSLTFFSEETGKYGSLKKSEVDSDFCLSYKVNVLCINKILDGILKKHDRINYIKIDTEGFEKKIIGSIEERFWKKIDCIYSENTNCSDIIPTNFKRSWRYDIEKIELNN
jgi:FkbM family methyltransferase